MGAIVVAGNKAASWRTERRRKYTRWKDEIVLKMRGNHSSAAVHVLLLNNRERSRGVMFRSANYTTFYLQPVTLLLIIGQF